MLEDNEIPCRNYHTCNSTTNNPSANVQLRHDAYGLPTGYYCEKCFENNYPYRKDRYYDYANAGELFDEDY